MCHVNDAKHVPGSETWGRGVQRLQLQHPRGSTCSVETRAEGNAAPSAEAKNDSTEA
jgi:hypothetical protein